MYSMDELAQKTGRSKQAIYSLIKVNPDLSSLIKQDSSKHGRYVKYGQDTLDWLIKHYQPLDQAESALQTDEDMPEEPLATRQDEESAQRIDELEEENRRLSEALEALRDDLERERSEKRELMQQNGQVLLLLSQEKHEKQQVQLLLTASEEDKTLSFRERLAILFGRKK